MEFEEFQKIFLDNLRKSENYNFRSLRAYQDDSQKIYLKINTHDLTEQSVIAIAISYEIGKLEHMSLLSAGYYLDDSE